jgi:hypothetical protein
MPGTSSRLKNQGNFTSPADGTDDADAFALSSEKTTVRPDQKSDEQ